MNEFNVELASAVCFLESSGRPNAESTTDITSDGYPFSFGLFQINLTVHNFGNLNCPDAFNGVNRNATVIDPDLYNRCKTEATMIRPNIEKACQIREQAGDWTPWGAYTDPRNGCS